MIRGLHHWGASLMIIVVVLHMTQVFLLGAYKKPREATWMVGAVLLLVTLSYGLTGYLLPWDNRAYWGTVVTTQIAALAPGAGPYVLRLLGSDGGSIDEGIALDAWLETVADLEELNVTDPAALTPEQMRDIFLTFIAHTIEGRLLQDIGANGLKFAADLAAIEAFESQLRDYIRRAVRDSFSSDISTPVSLSDRQIQGIIDRSYQDAWELLVTWGDAAG